MFIILISCYFNNFFIIPVVKKNIKLKLALAIPTRTPITLVKEIILIPPLVADNTIKVLSKLIESSNVFTELFTHYCSLLNF